MDYIGLPFNSPPPATFPAPLIYTGRAFNYYLVGETTISGDYNQDGVVDAADYVVWRKGLGTTYMEDHYYAWRANFGTMLGSGSGAGIYASIPEPSTLVMLIAAIGIRLGRRRNA